MPENNLPPAPIDLRDYFAGQALEGLVHYASASKGRARDFFKIPAPGQLTWQEEAAIEAYRIADAMLYARELPLKKLTEQKPGFVVMLDSEVNQEAVPHE